MFTLVREMYSVRNMILLAAAKYSPSGRMHWSTSKAVNFPQLAAKFLETGACS